MANHQSLGAKLQPPNPLTMTLPDLNPILTRLGLDPFERGLQLVRARELAADSFPRLDTDRPALVFVLDTSAAAEPIARTLAVNYPPEHPVVHLQAKRRQDLALQALPSIRLARQSVLYVPPLAHASSPLTLANIMARLRAPVGGCPWDLEQTHASITRALIEETYEVLEAISDQDAQHLMEELGDLQLHVLFQTQIARDQNEFALSDVGAELAAKLIRRHPHVFGDQQAADAAAVLQNWEKIKQEERRKKGKAIEKQGLDAGIPRHLPALTRAQKVSERARRLQPVENGRRATPAPRRTASPLAGDLKRKRPAARERALGEMLLELAAIAEEYGIDAERALQAATTRLVQESSAE